MIAEQSRLTASRRLATGLMLSGLALTAVILPDTGAVAVFHAGAVGCGLSLAIATIIESRAGLQRLIRADLLMLWVLYALTFLEFLFPQPNVDNVLSAATATDATRVVLAAMGAMVMGRHFVPAQKRRLRSESTEVKFGSADIFALFLCATALGYLHIVLAVNFDLIEMLRQMSLPRFTQAWARGRYGDLYTLLYELGMLISVIPPLAGVICARAKEFQGWQKAFAGIIFALTLYYGFASGTRSVIATHIFTFAGAYFLIKPRLRSGQIIALGLVLLTSLMVASIYMLEFRGVGLQNFSFEKYHYDSLFIDQNIVNIAQLIQQFPDTYNFLGLEIPFHMLIRPIPRFLWPGKPEGLSASIETALGAGSSTTLSCTFVGEAYMAGGFIVVVATGLMFGAAAEMWNRLRGGNRSQYSQLLFASGLLCAAIAMRSLLSMVPLMLPTVALWVYGKLWLTKARPASVDLANPSRADRNRRQV